MISYDGSADDADSTESAATVSLRSSGRMRLLGAWNGTSWFTLMESYDVPS